MLGIRFQLLWVIKIVDHRPGTTGNHALGKRQAPGRTWTFDQDSSTGIVRRAHETASLQNEGGA